MKILAIETSCDETAVSIVEAKGGKTAPVFSVRGNALYSQAKLHAKYGGVFPNLAKREHTKNIAPLTSLALKEAKLLKKKKRPGISEKDVEYLEKLLVRERGLADELIEFFSKYKKPDIDYIAVTSGPGLEPALWVGLNAAKALSIIWNIPLIPINHMEGHMFVSLLSGTDKKMALPKINFPAVSLLISGGHTELVLMKNWLSYKTIGQTRDDAVGEAFDKVARMLKLPYPGGPEISKLAATVKEKSKRFNLPRPMINSGDLDFSFSGIKTAVLYTVKQIPRISAKMKAEIAHEFETAAAEVLVSKTRAALKETKAKAVLVGGGVSANKRIRAALTESLKEKAQVYIPDAKLSTDNAIMIAVAAYMQLVASKKKRIALTSQKAIEKVVASGNMKL